MPVRMATQGCCWPGQPAPPVGGSCDGGLVPGMVTGVALAVGTGVKVKGMVMGVSV